MLDNRPDFPTMAEVEKANREQLAKWYRLLPSGDTKEHQRVQNKRVERFVDSVRLSTIAGPPTGIAHKNRPFFMPAVLHVLHSGADLTSRKAAFSAAFFRNRKTPLFAVATQR